MKTRRNRRNYSVRVTPSSRAFAIMNASEADMSTQNEDFVVPYLTLRQMIGWIGLLMPLAVRLGIEFVENGINPLASISAYYYSGMHDLFVCALILIGVLLACNRSPDVQ